MLRQRGYIISPPQDLIDSHRDIGVSLTDTVPLMALTTEAARSLRRTATQRASSPTGI
jgi:hypothetical protein